MAKSSDAFRTIGEVSDDLDVPKHVLRFWEGKFPQLKPMKRGGGRRFYRPEDVALLRGIHQLLHAAGYTIKGVQRILREDGVETVKAAATGALPPSGPNSGTRPGAPLAGTKRATASRTAKMAPAAVASPERLKAQLREIANGLEACLVIARGGPIPAPDIPQQQTKSAIKAKRR